MLNERESKNFLELAALAMKSNAIIDRDEKAVYETYKREVNLLDYQLKNIDREKIDNAEIETDNKESDFLKAFRRKTMEVLLKQKMSWMLQQKILSMQKRD